MKRITGVAGAAVAACLALTGCAVGSAPSEPTTDDGSGGSLTFVSSGSAFQDRQIAAWQKPFTEQAGVVFENDSPAELAKLKVMLDSGNVYWDVLDVTLPAAEQYCGEYFEKLDFSVIDKSAYPEGTVSECGVPAFSYSQVLLYDHDVFADSAPTRAADFFDLQKYPGKRLLPPELSTGTLEFTLLADGVKPADLYPLDVERALAKLDTIRGELVFAETYGQVQQTLESRQVTMALSLTARAGLAIENGAPYTPIWDGVIVSSDAIAIVKGSPNVASAMEFVAFLSEDPQQLAFAGLNGSLPINPGLVPEYTDIQRSLQVFPDHPEAAQYSNASWWAENFDATTARFTQWQLG